MTSGFDVPILTSPHGPAHGPQASVLAMSAPIAARLGLHWNSPEIPGGGVTVTVEEKLTLAREWQINSADSWLHATDRLIRGERIRSMPAETALDIRDEELEKRGDAYLDLDDWVAAVYAHGERSGWTEEDTDLVVRLAVKSYYVEEQLAGDGLLPAGERLVTLFAHDLASAAYLVHAGARMGVADPATVAQMLDALGHNASGITSYPTWASFGAAYVAGSSILFGGYPTDSHYGDPARTVRSLLSSPVSPWTNIPFPGRS
ncbi:DUF1266 domain-containing protein [Gordonia shandongensis]|uniref:DUF1266 domain-containing protein n=1 Tax=Gordonia shandongensis TaxID=376351 RepID=UPI0003FE3BB0|nr:DUF1266 domain-containing protein [Gordonia shandongensis]